MEKDDLNLINEAIKGNKKAIGEIIRKQQNNIYTTLYYMNKSHEDINDIAQTVLIKVYNNISKLKNANSFKTWLNKIILNSYYDYLRKKKSQPEVIYDEKQYNTVDLKSNPQDSVLYNELDIIIKKSIENLPVHYKIPITLREVQGLSYDEISNITQTSVGTVKSRISRARNMIQDKIIQYTRE